MTPTVACLGRLGSRFSLEFDPFRRRLLYGAAGLGGQQAAGWLLELREAGGATAALPFAGERPDFDRLNQQQTLTRLSYQAESAPLHAAVEVDWVAPFWPGQVTVSIAPTYLVRVRVAPLATASGGETGVVRFALSLPSAAVTAGAGGIRWQYVTRVGEDAAEPGTAGDRGALPGGAAELPCEGLLRPIGGEWRLVDAGYELPYRLADGPVEGWLIVAGWTDEADFSVGPVSGKLRYVSEFGSLEQVADRVAERHAAVVRASRFVDSLVSDSSLPRSLQDLIACAFQSFLCTTCWVDTAAGERFGLVGRDGPGPLSPAARQSLLTFLWAWWPDLLGRLVNPWAELSGTGRAPDALGEDGLLALYTLAVGWDREALYEAWREPLQRAAQAWLEPGPDHAAAADVAIGEGGVAAQFHRVGQLHAAARMLEAAGDDDLAERCYEEVAAALEELQDEAWCGDHYGCAPDRDDAEVPARDGSRPASGKPSEGSEAAPEWSLATGNGLVPLCWIDDLPAGLDRDTLRLDLRTARRAARQEYGGLDRPGPGGEVRLSVNLLRDQLAAYLGEGHESAPDRYQQLLVAANTWTMAGGYVDSQRAPRGPSPEGLVALAALWSAAGLSVRGTDRVLRLAPPGPCRVPLLWQIDWANLRAPWLEAEPGPDGLDWSIEGEDLLDGWTVVAEPAEGWGAAG